MFWCRRNKETNGIGPSAGAKDNPEATAANPGNSLQ
jgi:hypothetical protein